MMIIQDFFLPLQLQDADAPVYNLTGQQVYRGHKGIVISNGRKYVKK
jgi:hypothetical protein